MCQAKTTCGRRRSRNKITTTAGELTKAEKDKRFAWRSFGFRARGLKCEDVALTRDRERDSDIPMWKHERGSGTRHGQGIPYSVRSFHPTAKALEINVVRLKSAKNLPRKYRVVVQFLQPPGAKNVHFTSSWCKSCREVWSPKIRKYRFLRIRLVWASTANVACAGPLRQQPSFHSNRNISTLPPHQSQMFSLLQCRRDLISLPLQRLAASKTTHSTFS